MNRPHDETKAATGSVLVRICDICRRTTAIDLDPTPEHRQEMELPGHTVREVPYLEAMRLWEFAGSCKCEVK